MVQEATKGAGGNEYDYDDDFIDDSEDIEYHMRMAKAPKHTGFFIHQVSAVPWSACLVHFVMLRSMLTVLQSCRGLRVQTLSCQTQRSHQHRLQRSASGPNPRQARTRSPKRGRTRKALPQQSLMLRRSACLSALATCDVPHDSCCTSSCMHRQAVRRALTQI